MPLASVKKLVLPHGEEAQAEEQAMAKPNCIRVATANKYLPVDTWQSRQINSVTVLVSVWTPRICSARLYRY